MLFDRHVRATLESELVLALGAQTYASSLEAGRAADGPSLGATVAAGLRSHAPALL